MELNFNDPSGETDDLSVESAHDSGIICRLKKGQKRAQHFLFFFLQITRER